MLNRVSGMIEKNKNIVPNRIKQARNSRGLTMIELGERIGVSKQTISQYEMGKITPTPAILAKLSIATGYNICFFSKPLPVNNSSNSAVFFRKKKTTRKKIITAATEKIEIFKEINDYISEFVDFPELDFPKIEYNNFTDSPLDMDTIEEYAMLLRKRWNLGLNPISNLMMVVQSKGFNVSKMSFRESKLDAFSVWYDGRPYIFLSADKLSNARIRFDIAHELGHLLMHSDYYDAEEINKSTKLREKLEHEADSFAGALLMPRATFSSDVYSSSVDHFINLKLKWLTSISSMIYRCEHLALLSDSQIKYLKNQMTKRGYWYKEPLDTEITIEEPCALKQAVNLLLEHNIITPTDFENETGCLRNELEEYCFLPKNTLKDKEKINISLKKKNNILNLYT